MNDGGLGIHYNLGEGQTAFQHGGVRPVLSMEAKRRKSNDGTILNFPGNTPVKSLRKC